MTNEQNDQRDQENRHGQQKNQNSQNNSNNLGTKVGDSSNRKTNGENECDVSIENEMYRREDRKDHLGLQYSTFKPMQKNGSNESQKEISRPDERTPSQGKKEEDQIFQPEKPRKTETPYADNIKESYKGETHNEGSVLDNNSEDKQYL